MPLRGRSILVTRPENQATRLTQAITRRGGTAVLLPVIEIHPIELSAASAAVLRELPDCHRALFISANAVIQGLRHVPHWPPQLPAYAVGEATARALAEYGVPRIVRPADGADSEALLRLPDLNRVAGERIVVFRGVGGRELLADTLRQRGARVDYVETYERRIPVADPNPVISLCKRSALHAVCVNSGESLDNLVSLLGEQAVQGLRGLPLFVPHPRLLAHARAGGFDRVIVTQPGDDALLAALETHFNDSPPNGIDCP